MCTTAETNTKSVLSVKGTWLEMATIQDLSVVQDPHHLVVDRKVEGGHEARLQQRRIQPLVQPDEALLLDDVVHAVEHAITHKVAAECLSALGKSLDLHSLFRQI